MKKKNNTFAIKIVWCDKVTTVVSLFTSNSPVFPLLSVPHRNKKILFVFVFLRNILIMDGAGGNPSGGFDPCECIMSHEHVMNRLTNMLRNAQTTCVDTECFTGQLPGQPTTGTDDNTGMTNMYLILAIWLAMAFFLFIFRPRTLRNDRQSPSKPNPQNRHRDPPGPELH